MFGVVVNPSTSDPFDRYRTTVHEQCVVVEGCLWQIAVWVLFLWLLLLQIVVVGGVMWLGVVVVRMSVGQSGGLAQLSRCSLSSTITCRENSMFFALRLANAIKIANRSYLKTVKIINILASPILTWSQKKLYFPILLSQKK